MRQKTVWAFKTLEVLGFKTGFVQCPEHVADFLIASGDAQDPRMGALCLRRIESASPASYETKVIQPEARKRGRPRIVRDQPEDLSGGDDAPDVD